MEGLVAVPKDGAGGLSFYKTWWDWGVDAHEIMGGVPSHWRIPLTLSGSVWSLWSQAYSVSDGRARLSIATAVAYERDAYRDHE